MVKHGLNHLIQDVFDILDLMFSIIFHQLEVSQFRSSLHRSKKEMGHSFTFDVCNKLPDMFILPPLSLP